MNLEDKHFEHIAKMQALAGNDNWYSWNSPVGLTIFFLAFPIIGILVRFIFLMK